MTLISANLKTREARYFVRWLGELHEVTRITRPSKGKMIPVVQAHVAGVPGVHTIEARELIRA